MNAGEQRDRNHGEQPIAVLMRENGITAHRLVELSPDPITHKLVARACKGRWLTPKSRNKLIKALSLALGRECRKSDLFTY